jgi:hypothetical protein
MLSWSGHEHGDEVDLVGLAVGEVDADQRWARELHEFATAATGHDRDALDRARRTLVDRAGDDAMVDAAAVVANFEMMTRLADGTGARMPEARIDAHAGIVRAFGMDDITSKR